MKIRFMLVTLLVVFITITTLLLVKYYSEYVSYHKLLKQYPNEERIRVIHLKTQAGDKFTITVDMLPQVFCAGPLFTERFYFPGKASVESIVIDSGKHEPDPNAIDFIPVYADMNNSCYLLNNDVLIWRVKTKVYFNYCLLADIHKLSPAQYPELATIGRNLLNSNIGKWNDVFSAFLAKSAPTLPHPTSQSPALATGSVTPPAPVRAPRPAGIARAPG